jgi:hypothetical protein
MVQARKQDKTQGKVQNKISDLEIKQKKICPNSL